MKGFHPRPVHPRVLSDTDWAKPRAWYADLRDTEGQIRKRWKSLREELEAITKLRCAWCGAILTPGWHVDHYLPKERYPRVSYCWANLMPSCQPCNDVRKRDYFPPALAEDSVADPVLVPCEPATPYDAVVVLPSIGERLIDPTSEDPALHLRFQPALHQYAHLTRVGEVTKQRMFGEKDMHQHWEHISQHVKNILETAKDEAGVIAAMDSAKQLVGCEFFFEAYRSYWSSFGIGPATLT